MLRELIRFWRERWELQRRIAEELRFHVEQSVADKIAAGMHREEAERSARSRLGNRLFLTQQCLAAAGLDDLRSTFVPKRIPAWGWAVATVAVPGLLAAILIPHHFRPLPVGADHLRVSDRSYDQGFALAKEEPEAAAAFRYFVAQIGPEDAGRVFVGRAVSSNFFAVQYAAPEMGSGFSDSDEPEIMLSHRLWKDALDLDPAAVGRHVEVNGELYRIVGVMPEDYWFLHRVDRFWLRSSKFRGRRGYADLLVSTATPSAGETLEELQDARVELRPLEYASRRPVRVAWGIASAALALLAFLGLLQTVSLLAALGEERVPLGALLRNYLFLFAKALPVLVTVSILWIASVEGELLSPASYFGGVWTIGGTFIFALSTVAAGWYSLVDQRLRCPMCLRKLSMPVPFGIIGSILFDLPGTEYICTYGHGTLYMPEPTSEALRGPRWKEPAGVWAELLGSSPARLG